MVQIVENWSLIHGRVTSIASAPELSGFTRVELEVVAVDPVEGLPNLLEGHAGGSLSVYLPAADASRLSAGETATLRARRGGIDRAFGTLKRQDPS